MCGVKSEKESETYGVQKFSKAIPDGWTKLSEINLAMAHCGA